MCDVVQVQNISLLHLLWCLSVVSGWERLKALIRFFSRHFRNVLFFYGFKIFAFKFQFHDCWLCSDREDLRGDLSIERTLNVSSERGAVPDSGSREQWGGPQPWGTRSSEGCTSGQRPFLSSERLAKLYVPYWFIACVRCRVNYVLRQLKP